MRFTEAVCNDDSEDGAYKLWITFTAFYFYRSGHRYYGQFTSTRQDMANWRRDLQEGKQEAIDVWTALLKFRLTRL